jgi:hypothetical protein
VKVRRVKNPEVGWMRGSARYRVYFWPTHDRGSESALRKKWDIRDAEVTEALKWAEDNVGAGRTYTIYAVVSRRGDRGLVYLAGERTKERPPVRDDKKSVAQKIYEAVKLPVVEKEPFHR